MNYITHKNKKMAKSILGKIAITPRNEWNALTADYEYLFELFSPPGATAVSWRIENVTAGTSATGQVTDTLPNHLATMKHAISLTTVNAVARRIWLQTMYCECDR